MIINRQYGLLAPINWGEDVDAELQRQDQFWNQLIDIDDVNRAAYSSLIGADTMVAQAQANLDACNTALKAADQERKAIRKKARKRTPTPELDEQIKILRVERKQIAITLSALRAARKTAVAEEIEKLETTRFLAVKAARQEANWGGAEQRHIKEKICALKLERKQLPDNAEIKWRIQEIDTELAHLEAKITSSQVQGLYWGNANAVCKSYERGRSAVLKRLKTWRPTKPGDEPPHMRRKEHFNGSGRLTNQIQGGVSPEEVFAGAHSQVSIKPRQDGKSAREGGVGHAKWLLTVTAFRSGRRAQDNRTVTWPMVLHRPFPDGARIKEVVVHRRRIETHWQWTATFTCEVPDVMHTDVSGEVIAVDLGWRKLEDGSLRVATFMTEGWNRPEFIILPPAIMTRLGRPEKIRGYRDEDLLAMKAWLPGVPWYQAPPELQVLADSLRSTDKPTFGQFASLAIAWRRHPNWRPIDLAEIEEWRKRDKHLWLYEVNGRQQAIAHRLDHYRCASRELVGRASVIILEDFDLADAARRDSSPLHAAARHQRVLAAVHVLRHWIMHQAAKRGVKVIMHKGVSTWRCSRCQLPFSPLRDPAILVQQCPQGHIFDQDAEACRNMLAAYYASSPTAA